MPSKSLKTLSKKTFKKSKSKNKVKNIINLYVLRKSYDEFASIFFGYNVKIGKNQRPFTGIEINFKLS